MVVEASGPQPLATLACSVEGVVDLERRYPKGHPSWRTQVRVSVRPSGESGPVEQSTVWSDDQGILYFHVTEPGIYDIGAKSLHSLESRAYGVELQEGFTPGVNLGTLLEGDANDSNSIDNADFGLLRGAFWTANTATDFNVDGTTDVLDYSLLHRNYGTVGPRPATTAVDRQPAELPALRSSLQLIVDSVDVSPGEIFQVPIRVLAAGGAADAVEAWLAFDPARLRVVDATGADSTVIIAGTAMGTVIGNVANNGSGSIRYAAGRPFGSGALSEDFVLATIRFQALSPLGDSEIAVQKCVAANGGTEQALASSNGEIHVRAPTPMSTATPTAIAEPTMSVTPSVPATRLCLPLVLRQEEPANTSRFGVNVLGNVGDYELRQLGPIGWYQSWGTLVFPERPDEIEFVQLIRLRDEAPAYWPPDWDLIGQAIAENPGSLWLIGNEPDVETQDNCTPQEYAARYQQCYEFIKARDATAQISAAGIVQPTALRLRWLDQVRSEYEQTYGQCMPVDVWNIHIQILPERRDGWGCEIPPGLSDDMGEDHQVSDNVSVALFEEKVRYFRAWMYDQGEQEKPLVISEYGVLMPSGYGYLGGRDVAAGDQMVKAFMSGTFGFCLTATDPIVGCPVDSNRLVQKWAWYSLNDRMADFSTSPPYLGFNGSLFEWQRDYPGELTGFGRHFRDYVAGVPPS